PSSIVVHMVLPTSTLVEDPEVRRALARRSRDTERVKKLHDGRLRNNGADIIGIKNQLIEKEARAAREAHDELVYVQEQESIRRYLSRVEADEAAQRHDDAAKLRQEWLSQGLTRGERREADIARSTKDFSALNVDACSVATAQKFDGEDLGRHERRRVQASQVRDWTQSQLDAKHAKAADDMERDRLYDETMKGVGELQLQAEVEYDREKTKLALEVRRFNQAMASATKDHGIALDELNDRVDRGEIAATVQSDFMSENALQAHTSNPHRVRVDHWKGLSKDEVKSIVLSNHELVQAKQQRHAAEAEDEMERSHVQDGIRRQMAENEYAADKHRAYTQLEIQATLKRQVQQAKDRYGHQLLCISIYRSGQCE
ncbi:hypothetical protein DYB35_004182, partial [Aphanomyces astaci]